MSGNALGIWLMCLAVFVFALQDGFSRHLVAEYNVWMVITIRYWFFAILALGIAARRGALRRAWATPRPWLQASRSLLFLAEICILVSAFVLLGLTESHAIFALAPLLVAAVSGPVLGERVGRARWIAIGTGFAGVLIILAPAGGVFTPLALLPLMAAIMFALYAVLTRLVARTDDALTSFVWTGCAGAVAITPLGLWMWEPMSASDWGWMLGLCGLAALGQWLFIKTYEAAEASVVQPFAYLHLVFAAGIGVTVFGETLRPNVALGAAIVVAAGIFTAWRSGRSRPLD
ncbi:MAG: DMT family transporter [Pseudomonadota bacterium]